jgi:hypothetical protein
MLIWSAIVLRNPAVLRRVLHAFAQRFPWLVGTARDDAKRRA